MTSENKEKYVSKGKIRWIDLTGYWVLPMLFVEVYTVSVVAVYYLVHWFCTQFGNIDRLCLSTEHPVTTVVAILCVHLFNFYSIL